ncbi:MAG: hypothetical protein IPH05_06960 [Flavobacteriales bacterium]|nr:hypothetical protein [Flavobacteriales bacterium]
MLFMLALLVGLFSTAQPDGLARDFEKLSAKERARIAKREQDAAGKDPEYQAVMEAAEALFRVVSTKLPWRNSRKPERCDHTTCIRRSRSRISKPSILKRDAEEAAATRPEPTVKPAPTVGAANGGNSCTVEGGNRDPRSGTTRSRSSDPRGTDRGRTGKAPPEKVQVQPKPVALEGQKDGEEGPGLQRGRSVVVESRVTEEGRLVIYRKVSHPWGGGSFP